MGCMPGTRSIEFLSMLADDVVQHDLGGVVTAIVLSAYVTKEGPVPAKVLLVPAARRRHVQNPTLHDVSSKAQQLVCYVVTHRRDVQV